MSRVEHRFNDANVVLDSNRREIIEKVILNRYTRIKRVATDLKKLEKAHANGTANALTDAQKEKKQLNRRRMSGKRVRIAPLSARMRCTSRTIYA